MMDAEQWMQKDKIKLRKIWVLSFFISHIVVSVKEIKPLKLNPYLGNGGTYPKISQIPFLQLYFKHYRDV